MDDGKHYWFPAKTYGWGWGLPTAWQGWLVMGAFIVLLVASGIAFPPPLAPWGFATSLVVLCALLVGICWAKGEPPRWRWGAD